MDAGPSINSDIRTSVNDSICCDGTVANRSDETSLLDTFPLRGEL